MAVDQPTPPGGDSGGESEGGFRAEGAAAFSPEAADLSMVSGGSDNTADRLVGSMDLDMTNWAPTNFLIGKPVAEASLVAAANPGMQARFMDKVGTTTF